MPPCNLVSLLDFLSELVDGVDSRKWSGMRQCRAYKARDTREHFLEPLSATGEVPTGSPISISTRP